MSIVIGTNTPKATVNEQQPLNEEILMYDRDFLVCFEPLFNKRDERLYTAIEKVIIGEDTNQPKYINPSTLPTKNKTISVASVKKSYPILIPQKSTSRDSVISIHKEWRQKPYADETENTSQTKKVLLKDKKEKPKEGDDHRLNQRQKQIDYGKNTDGYTNYTALIPKDKRLKEHPRTPDKYQICSKRAWDGQVRKWRRQLHAYDPEGELSDDDSEIIDQNEQQDLIKQLDELANSTLEMNISQVRLPKEIVVNKESSGNIKELCGKDTSTKPMALISPPQPASKIIGGTLSNVFVGAGVITTPSGKSMMAPKAKRNILSDITNRDIKA